MAWEEIHGAGRRGLTGDKPLDAMALALRTIAQAYRQRFGRRPTATEILVALERVLRAHGAELVEDGALPSTARLAIVAGGDDTDQAHEVPMSSLPIDVTQFEGAYTDASRPGYYLVARRGRGGAEVVRVPRLEVVGRTVETEYDIVDSALDDEQARRLIAGALLKSFLDDDFKKGADAVHYRNLATGAEQTLPYPR